MPTRFSVSGKFSLSDPSVGKPFVNLFQIDGIVDAFLHGVIGAHLLNVTAVTTRAAVDNDDFVVRTVLGTLTVESDCYCHINYK